GERPAVAVLPEPPGGSTHPEVAAAVRRATDALADDGFKVTEAAPPDYEQAIELWSTILTADLRVMKPVLDELMGAAGRQFLDYALGYLPESDVATLALAHTARHGLARRWSLWYQEYPVLLSPVWTQPAFPLVYAAPDLQAAVADIEERFGVRARIGGRHPGRGTRNALLAVGPRTYLEIIAPDPEQPESAVPHPFRLDSADRGRLVRWALTCEDIDATVARARDHGYDPGDVVDGQRAEPAGTVLRWRMTSGELAGGLAPFLISWGDTEHPARSAPRGLTLE